MPIQDKLRKCFKEGDKGERHKGLRRIEIKKEKINGHLNKAKHNYTAITTFHNTGFSDWSASASFYCLYHALLALLAKYGFESRNQSCTFAFIEDLVEKRKITLTKEELKEIYDSEVREDLEHSDKILDIREIMQYSIMTAIENKEYQFLLDKTKRLFDKIRMEIEK